VATNVPASNPMAGTTQAAYTPGLTAHFQAGTTSPDDPAYEKLQRQSGGYQAGSFPMMEDKVSQGSDEQS
jgi:hypothetical protein